MSFISKLFRKAGAGDADEAAPVQAAKQPAPATGEPAENASAAQDGDAAGEDTDASAAEPAPAAEARLDESGETPWWEQASSPSEGEPNRRATPDVTPAAATPPGTQPLDPEKVERAEGDTSDGSTEGGTRPLTAADVPVMAAQRSRRGLAFGALRDVGRVRSINQDSVFALITTLPRESGDITLGLFIVADGMGGHHGGEVASRMAIGAVAHHVLAELIAPALADGATEALQPLLVAAVQEANRAIWEHGQLVGSDMGTTCTVALLLGHALYVAHVGDSRAYLAKPGGLEVITDDHSTVGRLIKLGQLDLAEAREHPLRSQLYRTIGQQPEVLVDFVYEQTGDATHLVLCSDGLWSMIDDEVILDVLEHSAWPQAACQELIARANLAGGEDNISAVVVTLPAQ
jgi:serine/threonine protein phosphatase PrpC